MKYLFLIALIVLASCSTTHKLKTEIHKTVDSTSTIIKDTTNVTKESSIMNDFNANDVDITLNYGTNPIDTSKKDVTVPWDAYYSGDKGRTGRINGLIESAVSGSGLNGRIPTSVTIHIGSLSDSSVKSNKIDSSSGKSISKADVKTDLNTKTKSVVRTGLGAGMYIIIGIVVIIILGLVVIKFKLY
jgi:hypothetical protein